MAEGITTLTDAAFEAFVKKNRHCMIDFWAEWCGPCMRMAPIYADAAKRLSGKVAFAKMNIDENQKVAKEYGIMSIPTFLVFKDGEHCSTLVGMKSAAELEAALK
ncbi:MAG: thioredoxin [Euryarchaeota archaeon]|nr:thioredoxin [Euryarchaeota archaeon]